MNISDIMDKSRIYVAFKPMNKRELLQEMADAASKVVNVDSRTIFDSLLERENLGSTGFGSGTAIPHARLNNIDKPYVFLVKTENAVDFEAVDKKPVDLAFLLLSPEDNGADHLTALALVSRILKDEKIADQIREEVSADKIFNLLKTAS